MKTKTHYMSVGINQTKKSLDWNWNLNLIAYGASNQIVLYDPQESCIVGISNESHGGYINSIQWIRNKFSPNKNFLLSTSTNGSAKLWIFEGTRTDLPPGCIKNSLKAVTTLTGHQGSVACADALIDLNQENEENKIFVVTTAEDNLIKGWKINSTLGTSEELFSYKLPGRSLALDLLILPAANCWPLIVYGGDDGKVHVMVSQEGEKYEPKYALTGHQDWITSLSYWVEDEGDTLLSSGSKDGSIRLWRIS
ncbi:UNVERIFIED_CONTAM: hypothetical protein GTU68_062294, partial [Idotea baltica]|nr:hypothetical protein [Idotea baltica]